MPHPRCLSKQKRLPIHILPILVSKLKKKPHWGSILAKVTQWESDWASPIVAIKKNDGDIRIYDNYNLVKCRVIFWDILVKKGAS